MAQAQQPSRVLEKGQWGTWEKTALDEEGRNPKDRTRIYLTDRKTKERVKSSQKKVCIDPMSKATESILGRFK
jgi:hypothetical protein